MKKLLTTSILALALLVISSANADVLVVVNKDNDIDSFSKRQLVDIYMGKNLYLPDGSLAIRLDQAPDSETREVFYRQLLGKSVAEVNAYWARLLFTGRASPPHVLSSSKEILAVVRKNKNAIGYVNESDVDDSVKVVGRVH